MLGPQPEHHFEGDGEQQKPARDAERRQRDAKLSQQPVADQRGAEQDRTADQASAQCDLPPDARRQPVGQADEHRREPNRIEHDKQRHQGGDDEVEGHRGNLENDVQAVHRCADIGENPVDRRIPCCSSNLLNGQRKWLYGKCRFKWPRAAESAMKTGAGFVPNSRRIQSGICLWPTLKIPRAGSRHRTCARFRSPTR
jgi:hypothetical protein